MGYRSDVKLLISAKGFEKLKEFCLKSDNECIREVIDINTFGLDRLECNCEPALEGSEYNEALPKGSVMLSWLDVKWYPSFDDVKAVEDVLDELDEMVANDYETIEHFYYKMIEIGEDGRVFQRTNDHEEEFCGDFYSTSGFSI